MEGGWEKGGPRSGDYGIAQEGSKAVFQKPSPIRGSTPSDRHYTVLPLLPHFVQGSSSSVEPGIEYEADSESELEDLGSMLGGGGGGQPPSRMRMLHQLWALGVPRRRGA